MRDEPKGDQRWVGVSRVLAVRPAACHEWRPEAVRATKTSTLPKGPNYQVLDAFRKLGVCVYVDRPKLCMAQSVQLCAAVNRFGRRCLIENDERPIRLHSFTIHSFIRVNSCGIGCEDFPVTGKKSFSLTLGWKAFSGTCATNRHVSETVSKVSRPRQRRTWMVIPLQMLLD